MDVLREARLCAPCYIELGREPCGRPSSRTATITVVVGSSARERGGTMGTEVLGPLERRIMDYLWRSGPSTVSETREALNRRSSHQLAYTTVMTILVRLHEKGYLTRAREARRYRYAAAIDEASL